MAVTSPFPVPSPAYATAVATAATTMTWAAARASGQRLLVTRGDEALSVPLGAVVVATLAGGLAAAALTRVSRRSDAPRTRYLVLCALGLAVSAVPVLQSASTPGTAAWLLVLHAVAAAVLIPAGLPRPAQALVRIRVPGPGAV